MRRRGQFCKPASHRGGALRCRRDPGPAITTTSSSRLTPSGPTPSPHAMNKYGRMAMSHWEKTSSPAPEEVGPTTRESQVARAPGARPGRRPPSHGSERDRRCDVRRSCSAPSEVRGWSCPRAHSQPAARSLQGRCTPFPSPDARFRSAVTPALRASVNHTNPHKEGPDEPRVCYLELLPDSALGWVLAALRRPGSR